MTTKKRSNAARLGALALALTLVSACLMGSTLARYAQDLTGTGTANIAKWNVALSAGGAPQTANFDFTLASTKDTNNDVATAAIAPGDKGKIEIVINGQDTEVAYEYLITLNTDNFTAADGNVQFYSDADCSQPWSKDSNFTKVPLDDVSTSITKTIYWQWENSDANNANDTKAGTAAKDITFTVQLTARQTITPATP